MGESMINGHDTNKVSTEKTDNTTNNYSPLQEQHNNDRKVSFFQKILNFLHINIFNRKIEKYNSPQDADLRTVLAKKPLEFDIKYTEDAIEAEIDYIKAYNRLSIYHNLASVIRCIDDFITNYSTVGAVNKETIIEFLEERTQYIDANIVALDTKGQEHNIIPPDINYLQSLDSITLKAVMKQLNKSLKFFFDSTFISVGYNPEIEKDNLANSIKSLPNLTGINDPGNSVYDVLNLQQLTISIPSGTTKLVYNNNLPTDSEKLEADSYEGTLKTQEAKKNHQITYTVDVYNL